MSVETLPAPLEELVEEFAAVPERDRLQLLLELSYELEPLPAAYAEHRDRLEPVPECQSPLFLAVELTPDQRVRLVFDAPAEAPTTRGFAAILHQGLSGLPAHEVLAVPDAFYLRLGLAGVVSPLRTRGLAAMLARVKRQIRVLLAAASKG
ncbi:MAG TPA: SufE family protein [Actinomycetes bacterium]|nr:SufE family protein [Actinomycetes bacterium]